MLRCTCFILALLLAQLLYAQPANYLHRSFISGADTLPYRILFPQGYNHDLRYPLVLVLHGAGERGNDNNLQLLHGSSLFSNTHNQKMHPAIVVFPQCAAQQYWSSVQVMQQTRPYDLDFDYRRPPTAPLQAVMKLLQQLCNVEAVDRRRIYVTGLSMGGMGTFELVHRLPRVFAAALPICGGGDAVRYTRRAQKVPFWIFHGSTDAVVDVNESRRMQAQLQAKGFPVRYTEYAGVGHNSWAPAFAEPEFLSWMFLQQRRRKARF